ncbi:unnamed protein product [Adineta ricciae]|uniref:Uncharacterized protein n=1 Tax=Adineta ricciae TaxID=249248 RepID=A0A816B2V3_ADIRI|nr:unnamed protein product [Adineta ricciae]CAF1605482.1 unnamed protein product [Adineta ricciae]
MQRTTIKDVTPGKANKHLVRIQDLCNRIGTTESQIPCILIDDDNLEIGNIPILAADEVSVGDEDLHGDRHVSRADRLQIEMRNIWVSLILIWKLIRETVKEHLI